MLQLQDVTVKAGGRAIVSGVSLALRAGELTALLGPNGAGKSTLMKLMAGELAPQSGQVRFHGRLLADWTPSELARHRSVLPQSNQLAFPFTVFEVVRLGVEARSSRVGLEREVSAALERVDLAGFGARRFSELSGGEQQRVHLARVLSQIGAPVGEDGRPRLLFLDEPTSSLDIRHQIAVLEIARTFSRAGGAVLAIVHDLNLAAAFADRIAIMERGTLAADGTPREVFTSEVLETVFGLPLHIHAAEGRPPHVVPRAYGADFSRSAYQQV
ncbi:heme ABC transporter ATP-binding protein [Mesorhizobium sp. RP14(2022)]|uniref:Heme ABC transporter ATP-binding protein n=1 Tax=Mesorhizobium liriopis TaxID=2953882 RepID=A0ABT1CBK7_9HYPH|nr:heme ABC transporter ATP-binding protein [Mesorhizobium liriopis]MCO6051571.1 heme ABC transporter ATP-binding protein [Mesorhizobium liriopis]